MPDNEVQKKEMPRYFTVAAILISLVGLADSAYLTAKHFSGTDVPCNIVHGCELVLNSQYAEFYGIPTAVFGAVAYFLVFSVALLVYFGNSYLWKFLGLIVSVMFVTSLWLIYLQAFVIGAFCQFCLLSAVTSTLLFVTFLLSVFRR
jgi:uncharacterized membrane protein